MDDDNQVAQQQQQEVEGNPPNRHGDNETAAREVAADDEELLLRQEIEDAVLRSEYVSQSIVRNIENGNFDFSDHLRHHDGVLRYYPRLMPYAISILSKLARSRIWGKFRIRQGNAEVPDRNVLDAFFQVLARAEFEELHLDDDLSPQVLQSLAVQFYQERGSSLRKLTEVHISLDCPNMAGRIPMNCPLFLICKNVEVYVPWRTPLSETLFQNMRRALQKPPRLEVREVKNDSEDELTIHFIPALRTSYEVELSRELSTFYQMELSRELSTLSCDFPFVNYGISFLWDERRHLPSFFSIAKLKSLHIGLYVNGHLPFQYPALTTECCREISNAIRESCELEELTLGNDYNRGRDARREYGDGYLDLVKAVVAGLDKNKSVRKLTIGSIRTGFHQDLWSALGKNDGTELQTLKFRWSESDARTIWAGLETNKSLLNVSFIDGHFGTHYSLYGGQYYSYSAPLLRRNKLLSQEESFCRGDHTPQEFLERLWSLSLEPIHYFNSASENIAKSDAVYRTTWGRSDDEEQPPLPVNFSALFVTIRKFLPQFINKSIKVLPLKDASDANPRGSAPTGLVACPDLVSYECPDSAWKKRTRRELSRRNRELELANSSTD